MATGSEKLALDGGPKAVTNALTPWPKFSEEAIDSVVQTLRSGKVNYWTGPKGMQFEREFAKWQGSKYAISVATGTAALHVSLAALGIGPGDEVIVPSYTFIATSFSVVQAGAIPRFADVNLDDHCISLESAEKLVTPRTKAIIPVHLYGNVCDMDQITAFAKKHNLFVIEDNAEAFGGSYKGQKTGTLSRMAACSFCQNKTFTTGGEGGMVTTDDEELAWQARSFRDHGYDVRKRMNLLDLEQHLPYIHNRVGWNYRMTEMQSAIGLAELARMDDWNMPARRRNGRILLDALSPLPQVKYLPIDTPERQNGWYVCAFSLDIENMNCDIQQFVKAAAAEGIPCWKVFWPQCHTERAFMEGNGFGRTGFPFTSKEYTDPASVDYSQVEVPNARWHETHTFTCFAFPTFSAEDVKQIAAGLVKVIKAYSWGREREESFMCQHCMNRREFGTLATAGLAGGILGLASVLSAEGSTIEPWDPDKPPVVTGRPLRVQPILAHAVMSPREKTSWRSWSEIINEPAAAEELQRIAGELQALPAKAGFPLEILPPAKVTTREQAANLQHGEFDAVLLYAASNASLFQPCCAADPQRDTVVFVRHKSGPTYYGYECLGVRHFKVPSPELWQQNSAASHGGVTLDDVVVDDYDEVLWRLRALYGLKNFVGQRVVALGGPAGKWDPTAPDVARQRYKFDLVEVSYDELAARLKAIAADTPLQTQLAAWTDRYLALPNTRLETKKEFIQRAFALYVVFRQWLREHHAPALTINACMGTALSVSDTTACMTLSWLNDEGYLAFCESDFVAVPPGVLLHYISGKPVFLHNSTFPHQAMVTCAHCTAPRRMDGRRYEPARIMTHYESDFGAAPKIEMPIGQQVCAISPEYATGRWVGIRGVVRDNPCFAICRSQQDVEIQGQWKRLIREARDSHWLMVYGDYLREVGYAARKIGLTWDNVSEPDA